MPSEVSIAKSLCGSEAREALVHAFTQLLARDDRFGPHMSYDGFAAKVRLEFFPSKPFIPPVTVEIPVQEGDQSDLETVGAGKRVFHAHQAHRTQRGLRLVCPRRCW